MSKHKYEARNIVIGPKDDDNWKTVDWEFWVNDWFIENRSTQVYGWCGPADVNKKVREGLRHAKASYEVTELKEIEL